MSRTILLFALVALAVLLANGAVLALSPKELDPSFDRDGRVVTDYSDPEELRASKVVDVAAHLDGKTVAGGYVEIGRSSDLALAQYRADGSLDEFFGGDGKVTTDLGGKYDEIAALSVQDDGKVVAVAAGGEWGNEPWMLRYGADGSLDESFGGEGRVLLNSPDAYDDVAYVADVAIQDDDKIVVAGTADGFEEFALARYEPDGSPDQTFGGDGSVVGDFNGQGGMANAIAIQADGKIVLAGEADDQHYDDAGLARYNPDGSPDTTFSGDGSMNVSVTGEDDEARGVVVQPNGKIVVALYSYYGAVLHRLEADGTYDRSFGSGGTVENPDVPAYKDLVIQEDGKIVALNYRDLARRMWGVTRYNRDGSVDRSLSFSYGWGLDQYPGARAMAVQPDGRIVLAGSLKGEDGGYDFALTRHLGAIFQHDTEKPTGGLTIDGGRSSTEHRSVELTLDAEDPGPNSSGVFRSRLRNAGGEWTRWSSYEPTKTWKLSRGVGKKGVYVQYKDLAGNVSSTESDTIIYRP
jgi:uncharacterized delta-60 repeat protein